MMEEYTIKKTKTYDNKLKKLDKSVRSKVEKKVEQLKFNSELGEPQHFLPIWALHVNGNKHRIFYTKINKKLIILLLTIYPKSKIAGKYPQEFEKIKKQLEEIKNLDI